jgi:hypothetical protein
LIRSRYPAAKSLTTSSYSFQEAAMKTSPSVLIRGAALASVLLTAAFATSSAQTADTAEAAHRVAPRSSSAARALALFGTAVPVTFSAATGQGDARPMLAGALVLGPALGYIYAGNAQVGLRRAGRRALVLGGAAAASAAICAAGDCALGLFGSPSGSTLPIASKILAAGMLTTAVLAAADIVAAGSVAALDVDQRRPAQVRPAIDPLTRTVGMALAW